MRTLRSPNPSHDRRLHVARSARSEDNGSGSLDRSEVRSLLQQLNKARGTRRLGNGMALGHMGVGQNFTSNWTAGFSLCFQLPWLYFGYLVLTHSHFRTSVDGPNPFPITLKPRLKSSFVGIYRRIIILGFLRWCRISSTHSMREAQKCFVGQHYEPKPPSQGPPKGKLWAQRGDEVGEGSGQTWLQCPERVWLGRKSVAHLFPMLFRVTRHLPGLEHTVISPKRTGATCCRGQIQQRRSSPL